MTGAVSGYSHSTLAISQKVRVRHQYPRLGLGFGLCRNVGHLSADFWVICPIFPIFANILSAGPRGDIFSPRSGLGSTIEPPTGSQPATLGPGWLHRENKELGPHRENKEKFSNFSQNE